jgi:hypothetical protein
MNNNWILTVLWVLAAIIFSVVLGKTELAVAAFGIAALWNIAAGLEELRGEVRDFNPWKRNESMMHLVQFRRPEPESILPEPIQPMHVFSPKGVRMLEGKPKSFKIKRARKCKRKVKNAKRRA